MGSFLNKLKQHRHILVPLENVLLTQSYQILLSRFHEQPLLTLFKALADIFSNVLAFLH